MKKNAMIQAFINALIEDKFVVVPYPLIDDFVKTADQVKVGKDKEPFFYAGGVYLAPNESEEYPLGGQGFYVN